MKTQTVVQLYHDLRAAAPHLRPAMCWNMAMRQPLAAIAWTQAAVESTAIALAELGRAPRQN